MVERLAAIAAAAGLSFVQAVFAQQAPIERVKMSDGEASCAQLFAEAGAMDKAVAEAKAAQEAGANTATAATAGSVAADVAGRTGLFGQLGGLAGHVFGQAAAQAGAGAAQQSGQQTARQGAERERQALARKEHVTKLFVDKGCKASDPNFNPPPGTQAAAAPGQAAAAALAAPVAPAPLAALPEHDPDQYFKGQTGGTFGKNVIEVLPRNRRVAVLGFRVAFVTNNTVSAQVRASYFMGRDSSGASSTLILNLSGVDQAAMQVLADRAYGDFLEQLRLAGREVVPQSEIAEFFSGVDVTPTPYAKENNGQKTVMLSPTGVPLWFNNWDAGWGDKGPFDQKNQRRIAEYSSKLNAIAVAPLILVNFARMSSSGNQSGLTARSAETGAELRMATFLSTGLVRSEETRDGLVMKGDDAYVRGLQPFVSKLEFGRMTEVAANDNHAMKSAFDALGKSMGMLNAGGANRKTTENAAVTDNAAYSAAATDVLRQATGTFAKLFQKYPVTP